MVRWVKIFKLNSLYISFLTRSKTQFTQPLPPLKNPTLPVILLAKSSVFPTKANIVKMNIYSHPTRTLPPLTFRRFAHTSYLPNFKRSRSNIPSAQLSTNEKKKRVYLPSVRKAYEFPGPFASTSKQNTRARAAERNSNKISGPRLYRTVLYIALCVSDDESGEKTVSVLLAGEESELTFIDHPCAEMAVSNTAFSPRLLARVYM